MDRGEMMSRIRDIGARRAACVQRGEGHANLMTAALLSGDKALAEEHRRLALAAYEESLDQLAGAISLMRGS